MEQQVPGDAVGSPRRAIGRRRDDDRSRPSRTTRPPHGSEGRSRSGCGPSERGQVTPLVRPVERMLVVGRVARVHLGGTMPGQQRREGFIHKRGVCGPRAKAARTLEKSRVDRRAQSCAIHATIMPLAGEPLRVPENVGRGRMDSTSCWVFHVDRRVLDAARNSAPHETADEPTWDQVLPLC